MKKISVKVKLIANFEENSEDMNKKHNKKDFHKVYFIKVKKNIYYIY